LAPEETGLDAAGELAEERRLREEADRAAREKEEELQGVLQQLVAVEEQYGRKDARIHELTKELGEARAEAEALRAAAEARGRAPSEEEDDGSTSAELYVARHEIEILRGELEVTKAELAKKKVRGGADLSSCMA
jgi:chromosome segregation ATPase